METPTFITFAIDSRQSESTSLNSINYAAVTVDSHTRIRKRICKEQKRNRALRLRDMAQPGKPALPALFLTRPNQIGLLESQERQQSSVLSLGPLIVFL
jgi:hypothetical protein